MKKLVSLLTVFALTFSMLIVPAQAEEFTVDVSKGEVRLLGRGELLTDGSRTFNWPNAGVEFTFTGTKAEIFASDLRDGTAPENSVYFNISVNDAAPTRVALTDGWNTLYEGEEGTYKIRFVRSSEPCKGTSAFSQVRITGTTLAPTEKKDRFIEFLGDSYTSGYGNSPELSESTSYCAQNTDNWNSFPGFVARHFDADFTSISYQGKGVYINHGGGFENTMSEQFLWNDIYVVGAFNMSTKSEYNFNKATPDILVLFLGTNDYYGISKNEDATADGFTVAYENLLKTIREKYPQTHILCVSKKSGCMQDQVSTVVSNMQATDDKIHRLILQNFSASGISGHPTVEEDKVIADEIIAKINTIPGVWNTPDFDSEATDRISLYANYNNNTITVAGNTGVASDTVSALVTYPGATLSSDITKDDIAYLYQTKTDNSGTYELIFDVTAMEGEFNFYMNSISIDERTSRDFNFKTNVPTISITKGETVIDDMDDVSVGDDITLKIVGFEMADDFSGMVALAQYDASGRMIGVSVDNANGSNMDLGDEFMLSTKVLGNATEIRVIYAEKSNLRPVTTGVYTID